MKKVVAEEDGVAHVAEVDLAHVPDPEVDLAVDREADPGLDLGPDQGVDQRAGHGQSLAPNRDRNLDHAHDQSKSITFSLI